MLTPIIPPIPPEISSIATIKLQKRGIVNGLIIGLLYILIYLLISLIFFGNINFSSKTIFIMVLGLISGGIGGIIGVNINKKN